MYLFNDGLLYASDDFGTLLVNSLQWAITGGEPVEIDELTSSAGFVNYDSDALAYSLVLPAGKSTAELTATAADSITVTLPSIDVAEGETKNYEIVASVLDGFITTTYTLEVHAQTATEILYVSSSNGVLAGARPYDTNVYDAMVGAGHSVTLAPKGILTEEGFDYSIYAGMVLSGGMGSSRANGVAQNGYPIPCVSMQNDGPKNNKWGWVNDNNAEEHAKTKSYDATNVQFKILNNEHPITTDYEVDQMITWTNGTAESEDFLGKEIKYYNLTDSISEAVALATIPGNDGQTMPTMWAVPEGTSVRSMQADGSYARTETSSNVVLMYLFNDGLLYMSEDLKPLLLNSLEWAMSSNVEAKKVAYVTNGDNVMDETAATVIDDPIIRMLDADENIDLDVIAVSSDATVDLSGYDVVIAQESFSSGADLFKPTGSLGMANIEVPFIFNKVYAMKDTRGFTDEVSGSGGEVPGTYYINVSSDNQENPLFSGVEFTGDSVQIFKTGATDAGGAGEKGFQYAVDVEISSENTLLANGVNDPDNVTICINDIPSGSTIGSETLQARMFAFAMNFGAICKDGGSNITDAGLAIWRNAVYLAAGLEVPAEGVANTAAIESIATNAGFVNFNDEAGAAQLVLPVGTSTADLSVTTVSSDAEVVLPTINVTEGGAYEDYEIVVNAPYGGSVVYALQVHVQAEEEILFLSSDPRGVYSAAKAFDTKVFDPLVEAGYSVTFVDRSAIHEWTPDGDIAFDYSIYSGMVIGGGAGSSNTIDYAKRNYPIPVVSLQNDGPKGNKWGWDIDPVTTKSYDEETVKMEILTTDHPITEGFNVGDKVQWTLGTADSADWSGNEIKSYNLTDDIPSAVALAKIVADGSLEPTMWAIPAGVEVTSVNDVYDNYETVTTSSNIVLMYLFNDGLLYASDDFGTLLVNSLEWAMSEVTQSSDATLSSLTVSEGALDPEFAASTTSYTVNLPTGTASVTVEAVANQAAASVSGAGEITIPEGGTTIDVVVTAEDGTTKTYTVEFTVGVGVDDLANVWSIYPNPVRSMLNIDGAKVKNVEIFNMSGIKMDVHSCNLSQVNVSNLVKGVYVIKIEGADNAVSIQKFTKE
jgi:hypothetical protein